MANKLQLSATYGASPGTVVDGITGIDIITADNATNTSANRIAHPIEIPGSGSNYSYEKYLRFKCITSPDTQIYNIKVWSQNSVPETGVTMYWKTASSYSTPSIPTDTTGWTRQDTNYTSSGTGLTVSGVLTASGQYSDYLMVMYDVTSSASSGAVTQISLNYNYSEQ